MAGQSTQRNILTISLIAFTATLGLAVWPDLPSEIAVHFSTTGTPDNYISKTLGVVLMPVIMVATLLILETALRYDPPKNLRTAGFVSVSTMALLAAIQCFILAWNLGYSLPPESVFIGAILWALVIAIGTVALEQ